MDRSDLHEVLHNQPFVPLEVGLTDGRVVTVRHPDQVMNTRRNAVLGLTQIKDHRHRLRTPANDDRLVKDWLMVDLLHGVSAEPANGTKRTQPRRRKRTP